MVEPAGLEHFESSLGRVGCRTTSVLRLCARGKPEANGSRSAPPRRPAAPCARTPRRAHRSRGRLVPLARELRDRRVEQRRARSFVRDRDSTASPSAPLPGRNGPSRTHGILRGNRAREEVLEMKDTELRELCTRYFDAVERHDVDAVADLYAPGFTFWVNVTGEESSREANLADAARRLRPASPPNLRRPHRRHLRDGVRRALLGERRGAQRTPHVALGLRRRAVQGRPDHADRRVPRLGQVRARRGRERRACMTDCRDPRALQPLLRRLPGSAGRRARRDLRARLHRLAQRLRTRDDRARRTWRRCRRATRSSAGGPTTTAPSTRSTAAS